MATYITRRILWVFVLLFCVLSLTFVVFSVLPSADPALPPREGDRAGTSTPCSGPARTARRSSF